VLSISSTGVTIVDAHAPSPKLRTALDIATLLTNTSKCRS
jgi:hypothetical protein